MFQFSVVLKAIIFVWRQMPFEPMRFFLMQYLKWPLGKILLCYLLSKIFFLFLFFAGKTHKFGSVAAGWHYELLTKESLSHFRPHFTHLAKRTVSCPWRRPQRWTWVKHVFWCSRSSEPPSSCTLFFFFMDADTSPFPLCRSKLWPCLSPITLRCASWSDSTLSTCPTTTWLSCSMSPTLPPTQTVQCFCFVLLAVQSFV